jgi:hypothetical protein
MTKLHLCKKIKDNKECGDTNPENFEKGRFSICRECRKLCSREQTIETKRIIQELNDKIKILEERIKELEK